MKLQFSLATILICIAVLAVVCAICVQIPVTEEFDAPPLPGAPQSSHPAFSIIDERPPTLLETGQRLAIWWPSSIAAIFTARWAVGRLKFRRENGATNRVA